MSTRIFNKIIILQFINISHETVSFIPLQIIWHKFRNVVICKFSFSLSYFSWTKSLFASLCNRIVKIRNFTKRWTLNFLKSYLGYSISRLKFNLSIRKVIQNNLNVSTKILINDTSSCLCWTWWNARTRIEFCKKPFWKT